MYLLKLCISFILTIDLRIFWIPIPTKKMYLAFGSKIIYLNIITIQLITLTDQKLNKNHISKMF